LESLALVPTTQAGLPYYRFAALCGFPEVTHGIFTRWGGVSGGCYGTLNVSARVGDEPSNVFRNRRRIAATLGAERLAFVDQVHGDRVLALRFSGEKQGPRIWETGQQADAVVTDRPGLLCAVQVADCQSVFLHDPHRKVVAAVHCGWRGNVLNVGARAVEAMCLEFSCRPRDLTACIGPSLGPCCAQFVNFRTEFPKGFRKYRVGPDRFDLWSLTRDQLCQAGLQEGRVHIARVCSRCRSDIFYSYRKEGVTGRCAAVIGIGRPGERR